MKRWWKTKQEVRKDISMGCWVDRKRKEGINCIDTYSSIFCTSNTPKKFFNRSSSSWDNIARYRGNYKKIPLMDNYKM
jgi:hypothetical protein